MLVADTLQTAAPCFASYSPPLDSMKENCLGLEELAAVIAVQFHPLHWKGYRNRISVVHLKDGVVVFEARFAAVAQNRHDVP